MIVKASLGRIKTLYQVGLDETQQGANALLTVNAGTPVITAAAQSYAEGAGDHVAFAPGVAGSTPLNNPLVGATNTYLVLTNIQTSQSGTYILVVSNAYGSTRLPLRLP